MSQAGRAYLATLDPEKFDALRGRVIASLGCFRRLNEAEREDVATEAILRALRSEQLDPSNRPDAYIKKIAKNMALQKLEKLKGEKTVLMDNTDLNTLLNPTVEAGEAEQDLDLEARASQAMSQISSPQQREVTERRARGEKAAQVAASLGISKQQVYTQYNRGRAQVRSAPQVRPFIRSAYVQSAGRERLAEDGE
ncbi:sigma-70 family RNA polymerase sigma factor [Streptomyces sp. 372A]